MDLKEIADLLPVLLAAATFGVTFVVYTITTHQGKIDAPDWLPLVPFVTGFALAIPWYIVQELPQVPEQTNLTTALWCFIYGFGYGGAAVGAWELQKGVRTILGKALARAGVQTMLSKLPFRKTTNGSSSEEPPTQSKGGTP
jgi:hypothetical protein